MTQKTTTQTTTSPVEAFSLHLRSQGYALISLPGGVKLRNINTFRGLMEPTMAVSCI